MNENIYLVGGIYSSNDDEVISNSKTNIQIAADNYQKSLLKGFYQNDLVVKMFSLPFTKTFPKYYKSLFMKKKTYLLYGHSIAQLPFCCLPILNFITKFIVLLWALLKIKTKGNSIVIYSMHTPLLLAAVIRKLLYKGDKITLIVPDLPIHMSSSRNVIYLFFKKIDGYLLQVLMKYVNSYVLISENMKEVMDIKEKKAIVIEGIFDDELLKPLDSHNLKSKKIILYTGSLDLRYGIKDLVDSFCKIEDDSLELWVCGLGNGDIMVQESANIDSRIKNYGFVTHSEILKMQQQAMLLVNPRGDTMEFTRYSFPSKTLEYMASGTPCLMYKLSGLPEAYIEFLYLIENSSQNLGTEINMILHKSAEELYLFGKRSQEFILNEKTPKVQVSKIIKII